ncbi:4Fe-4S dicluster domain-containing protein [Nocardia higoensis]|uniref:4Fe-4S dicluster domain-containing protein n=1 Tax=Nocardia higoensis TaxID=228599 RepID=A0ABS0D7P9_9NOCA|nr:4Fe-4S dicluster domain-containing protein [Nocardia higoensis]MBF6353808.1 4Fe-4S dicluster domain-containing protein [Nocardia higoensis]
MIPGDSEIIDRTGLNRLVEVLAEQGYRVIGPQLRDGAIVLDELASGMALPDGWGVEAEPGRYRVRRRDDGAVFAHSAGPGSWKTFLHPPRRKIADLTADLVDEHAADPPDEAPKPYAFLGVRGCDLAAISVLGRVLDGGTRPAAPPARRRGLFVVAVNCTEPGGVCFCASMGTGPSVSPGYDLALTEQVGEDGHRFVVDVGSDDGARILSEVTPRASATTAQIDAARTQVSAAADRMGRVMPEVDLRALLRDSRESPHWQDVASRCFTCGNCTMVCPTCFCTSVEDVTDVTGEHAERWEKWASCYELDFSYLHGGSVRQSGESRYRQWITHKLSTWYDQFGTSGCVGCGRCIAWCPAAIDLTEEVAALAALSGEVTHDALR